MKSVACCGVLAACTAFASALSFSVPQAIGQATYTLKPTPKTVAWGYYDAKATRVLRVKSDSTLVGISSMAIAQAADNAIPRTSSQEAMKPVVFVKHLELPLRYPLVARLAGLQGTVALRLMIAIDGKVISAELAEHAHPLLQEEAEKLVRKWTFGCVQCSPDVPYATIIRVVYRLEGDEASDDHTRVVMDLPDEVSLIASPPVCDHCPPKKTVK